MTIAKHPRSMMIEIETAKTPTGIEAIFSMVKCSGDLLKVRCYTNALPLPRRWSTAEPA